MAKKEQPKKLTAADLKKLKGGWNSGPNVFPNAPTADEDNGGPSARYEESSVKRKL